MRIFTKAPPEYDYGHTVEVGTAESAVSGTFRIVEIAKGSDSEQYLTDYQVGRYQSGMYAACNEAKFKKLFAPIRTPKVDDHVMIDIEDARFWGIVEAYDEELDEAFIVGHHGEERSCSASDLVYQEEE